MVKPHVEEKAKTKRFEESVEKLKRQRPKSSDWKKIKRETPMKPLVGGKIIKEIIKKIVKKPRHKKLDVPGLKGPEIGKYPGIDKAMENIKKSGDIWGPGKAGGGRATHGYGKAYMKGGRAK